MDSFAIIILLVIILSFVVVMLIMKLRYRLPWKDFFRRRLDRWKKQSRWRNPYTYMYIFIGLMLSFVMVFAIHTNHQLRTTIGEVRRENLEYHNVAQSGVCQGQDRDTRKHRGQWTGQYLELPVEAGA